MGLLVRKRTPGAHELSWPSVTCPVGFSVIFTPEVNYHEAFQLARKSGLFRAKSQTNWRLARSDSPFISSVIVTDKFLGPSYLGIEARGVYCEAEKPSESGFLQDEG